PDLADALRIELALGGGMMGRGWPVDPAADRAARRARRLAGAKEADPAWTVNRRAHMAHGAEHGFEFTAQRGRTVLITLRNDTAWWHPMHLHGHSWRELSRNGHALADRPWRDTTLLAPGDTVDVAFVADNPGDWLLHCHVLEHHAGGMGVQFRVV
ncbi:MAG TPA: multicopper oxidase domain-containing protein, partial [Burkholderiaceae bacterium]